MAELHAFIRGVARRAIDDHQPGLGILKDARAKPSAFRR
jgi:hypothetical protein